jgi:hypothetical protein
MSSWREVLEIPRQKSSCPTCFNCHPQKKIFADVSQDNKRKYGDRKKMVPQIECKA